jgi:hypothetical protein
LNQCVSTQGNHALNWLMINLAVINASRIR